MTDGAAGDLPAVPDDFVAIGPPIASGGSAVVWRARHRVTGTEVALKVWHQPLSSAEQRAQFDAESRLHQQLSGHPHVVRWLWAAAPTDAPAWMATELHGAALSELTAESGPLSLSAGVVVGLDLLDGLAAVHAKGIVHRDVKPENVLVKDGRAALCDLGIAMHIDTLTQDTCAGTTAYLAPELLRPGADQSPDFRSDVYSAARTIRSAVGDDVPDALDQLLTRAESEEPADRPADAADFRDRLLKVSDRLGLATPPPDSVEVNHRPRGWRRPLIVIAAGVLGVAIIGIAVGLLSGSFGGAEIAAGASCGSAGPGYRLRRGTSESRKAQRRALRRKSLTGWALRTPHRWPGHRRDHSVLRPCETRGVCTADEGQVRQQFRHVKLPRADPLQLGRRVRFRLVQLSP